MMIINIKGDIVENNTEIQLKQQNTVLTKIIPLSLMVAIILLDQWTKFLIVKHIPPYTVGISFFGDFLRIIHVLNKGVAFSVGTNLPDNFRTLAFAIIPLIVLIIILVVYFKSKDFTFFQDWLIAGIIGGGFGNLIDRFFRPDGVVDFIDVKFYGILGYERWPTFNVADMSVVICGTLLFISFLGSIIKEDKQKRKEKK